ncbi:hypothetical protein A6A06_13140 [Streptomyces sp. CB02923]|uniref:hypothetical protein n=1 Tax=Streptomyces sp. CB02923 TaxID=1718985 RepID=UPI00093AE894|nr:hypothetical protein [Streptomyces sp. CB02923]OKI02043.1 hypothetical protein A6A06_13140 [Streptomyces sp. CB02923]
MTGSPKAAACRRCGAPDPELRTCTAPVVDCTGRLLVATSVICACGAATLVGLRPARTADGGDARADVSRQLFPFAVY